MEYLPFSLVVFIIALVVAAGSTSRRILTPELHTPAPSIASALVVKLLVPLIARPAVTITVLSNYWAGIHKRD